MRSFTHEYMKKHLLAFVDLEATALSPERGEIFEIGIVLAEQSGDGLFHEGVLRKLSEHEILLLPEHIETADPKSLEIAKYDERDWTRAVTQKAGLEAAGEILKGKVFVAQNVGFDWARLESAGMRYGIDFDSLLHYHKLDLASMAFGKLYREQKLSKFSLREMSEYFGVTNGNAHTALSDARATFEIAEKILSTE